MNTKLSYPLFLFFIPLLLFGSCIRERNGIAALRQSVTDHYASSDSTRLQLEAASFLFDNLPFHSSALPDDSGEILSSDFFIRHIDHCFRLWRNSEFAKNISFDQFKEYILPFEVCQGATPIISADERWLWVRDNIIHPDSIESPDHFVEIYNQRMSELSPDDADCTIKASQCVLNMRAVGIPSVAERNIAYRRLTAFHVHCAYFDIGSGNFYRFNAEDTDSKPDSEGWNWTEMQNIYRIRFSPDIDSPFFLRRLTEFPIPPFDNPCMTDVTRTGGSAAVGLPADSTHNIVYLAVFNRDAPGGMIPVAWGLTDSLRTTASFRNLLPNTLYFPGVSEKGKFIPIAPPFMVRETGGVFESYPPEFMKETDSTTETVTLTRKYPLKESDIKTAESLVGSRIEAADNPEFNNAVILLTLREPLKPLIQNFKLADKGEFKYYRFVPPASHPRCDISILRWFIGEEEIKHYDGCVVYDGDMTTAPSDSAFITFTLALPLRLTNIEIAPKNSDNAVTSGHDYILRRYDMSSLQWTDVGRAKAVSDSLRFGEVPRGSLLWLSDISKGREETPFIYSNGKQTFLYYDLIPE